MEEAKGPMEDVELGNSKGLPPLALPVIVAFRIEELEVARAHETKSKKDKKDVELPKKKILQDVAGVVYPTNLLAIMGPSGAGKTSLLNCLSLRNRAFKGTVTYNGQQLDADRAAQLCAYVQQEDLFVPTLTPREHLMFHATMRMGKHASPAEREKTVDGVIAELGLVKCQHTLIGGQGSIIRGISGGEKKRLSFATEVLADPAVLFVDEPTSGLDSFMAASVVSMLQATAKAGRTVVATVHQPSSDVFTMFSHLHLLVDGRTAFFGPMEKAVTHFGAIGYTCPNFYNPADYYIALMSRDTHAVAASNVRIDKITNAFPNSESGRELQLQLQAALEDPNGNVQQQADGSATARNGQQGKARNGSTVGVEASASGKESGAGGRISKARRVYSASWGLQVAALYKRTLLAFRRDPILTRVRFVQAIVVAVIVGLIYLQLGTSQADVQALMGCLFFVTLNQSILGTIGVLQVFPNETPVLLREHAAGAYRVDAFFLARTLAELPFQILFPAVHATVLYWLVGLPKDAYVFFMFIVTIVMTANAAISMGYLVSAMAKNTAVALALGPMCLLPMIIFGGLLVNVQSIPKYFLWLSVFSFVQYGYEANCKLIFGHMGNFECPPEGACAFPTGASVLSYLSFNERGKWVDWVALLALIVGFRSCAYLALVYRCRRSSGGY